MYQCVCLVVCAHRYPECSQRDLGTLLGMLTDSRSLPFALLLQLLRSCLLLLDSSAPLQVHCTDGCPTQRCDVARSVALRHSRADLKVETAVLLHIAQYRLEHRGSCFLVRWTLGQIESVIPVSADVVMLLWCRAADIQWHD